MTCFDDWCTSLGVPDNEPYREFLREIFDGWGPVDEADLPVLQAAKQEELAHLAVELFRADLRRTTDVDPPITIRWDHDIDALIVAYKGGYRTPIIHTLRAPEAIVEVADNLQDHVVDDLWTVWPMCHAHGSGLEPRTADGKAVWWCPRGAHAAAEIGSLGVGHSPR